MDLQWPSMKKSFKEFKHQFNNNHNIHYPLFIAYAAETIALGYVNPWLSFAVNGLGMGCLALLMIFGQAPAADMRKLDYDKAIYVFMRSGRAEVVTDLASHNEYRETNKEVLKAQNTKYLYQALCGYHQEQSKGNSSHAAHYLQAAEILLAHHADSDVVIQQLKQNYSDNIGITWLEIKQGTNHKAKLS